MQVCAFGNLRSLSSQTTFGSLVLSSLATEIAGKTVNLSFVNGPTDLNAEFSISQDPSLVGPYFTFMPIMIYLLVLFTTIRLGTQFHNGTYNQLMMKSGAPVSFFFAMYLVDIFIGLWVAINILLWPVIFGFHLPYYSIPTFLWVIVNPLFCYTMAYYFTRRKRVPPTSSIVIATIGYFAFALVTPALSIFYSLSSGLNAACIIFALLFFWMPMSNLAWSAIAIAQTNMIAKLRGQPFD